MSDLSIPRRFQTLSESALDTFETVKDLEFGRNPLHCNCHLKWLKEYYERTVDRYVQNEKMVGTKCQLAVGLERGQCVAES